MTQTTLALLSAWIIFGVIAVGAVLYTTFTAPECAEDAASIRGTYESLRLTQGEGAAAVKVLGLLILLVIAWPWLFTADDE